MAWNEPGGNDNDPWGNRKNSGGPPDLDEVFKNVKSKLDGLLGNKGQGSGGRGSLPTGGLGSKGIGVLLGLVLIAWIASGIYVVQPAEQGVVTQFGKLVNSVGPGPHWHIPWPVQAVTRVDVAGNRTKKLSRQLNLTQDENIVKIDLSVQYDIKSASDYLFNLRDPDLTLEQVVESAIREVIGQTDMETVLTTVIIENATNEDGSVKITDVDEVQNTTKANLQSILDQYGTGINVISVNLEKAQPPDEVQAAFSDAIKAREDRERYINEAQAYRNEVLPRARGDAQRVIEESEAYKTRVEQSAEGESRRFLSLLTEYKKAPDVTRERLYIEAMEAVLANTSKVFMDTDQGNSLMYLPIDKLIEQNNTARDGNSSASNQSRLQNGSATSPSNFDNLPTEIRESASDVLRSRDRGVTR